MPSKSSIYHKFNRVKRADGKDQDEISVDQFKQVEANLGKNPEQEVSQ